MKPNILIRADGGPQIGLGHLIRCSALAHMLKDYFEINFFCKEIPQSNKTELQQSGFPVVQIESEEQFIDSVSRESIVVLDSYEFGTDYQRKIKAVGAKLVCIDDLHDKHYVADVVINHAINDKKLFSIENYTKLFLGLEYALIRKDFFINFKQNKIKNTLLINFGGSDFNNLTLKILDYLLERDIHIKFKTFVLVGSTNNYSEKIENLCNENNFIFYKNLNSYDLSKLFERIEFAILPASTIMIEALYKDVKIIGGYFVEDQKQFFNNLLKSNYIYPIGNFNNYLNFEKIITGLSTETMGFEKIKSKREKLVEYVLKL